VDLRRASSGSVSLSPVMEQLVGLLGGQETPLLLPSIRESAVSRQVTVNITSISMPCCLSFSIVGRCVF